MTTDLDVDRVIRGATNAVRKKYLDPPERNTEATMRERLGNLLDPPVRTESAAGQRSKRLPPTP